MSENEMSDYQVQATVTLHLTAANKEQAAQLADAAIGPMMECCPPSMNVVEANVIEESEEPLWRRWLARRRHRILRTAVK
jgi:hypothetical protein